MTLFRRRLVLVALIVAVFFTPLLIATKTTIDDHAILANLATQTEAQNEHRSCNEFYHRLLTHLILSFARANPKVYGDVLRQFQGLPEPERIDPEKCGPLTPPILIPGPTATQTIRVITRTTTTRMTTTKPGPTVTTTAKPSPQPTATVTCNPTPLIGDCPRGRIKP